MNKNNLYSIPRTSYPIPELRFNHTLNSWEVFTFINKLDCMNRRWFCIDSIHAKQFASIPGVILYV